MHYKFLYILGFALITLGCIEIIALGYYELFSTVPEGFEVSDSVEKGILFILLGDLIERQDEK